ncbi:uncharacterized protein LOC108116510 [Drosophila eugracilis]|uniref:uncharacterized protein LOC108116510 n=1 Tax=Drosophila eugracilis TaxID=29029 RepID=UPI0007E87E01|nr:uncharacterized protein LOC108116510 [Drosophila eugracilis]
MCKSVIISLAIVACFSMAMAQNAQSCASATSKDFNNTDFSGLWYELARNPASNVSCTKVNIAYWGNANNGTNMLVDVSHASNNVSTLIDVFEKANVTLVTGQTTGYNVTFTNGQSQDYVFIKILDLVNSTYLLGCSYTDANNASTSAAFILGRSNYTLDGVKIANNDASTKFSNFQNNTYGNVTQLGCRANSAGKMTPLTLISAFLAIALLLIKA